MNQLFKKDPFSECRICAYHESGHILFAYLCGYNCKEAGLIDNNNEEGYSGFAIIDYGHDSYYASRLTGTDASIDFFKSLSFAEKLHAIEIGRRLARIFLGGSISAAVFINDGNPRIPLPIQIDWNDLLKAEFIHNVITELTIDKEENFIEYGLQDALYTVSNINVWNTIEDLSERLLNQKYLKRNDIEECLESHGIIYDEESPIDASFDFH